MKYDLPRCIFEVEHCQFARLVPDLPWNGHNSSVSTASANQTTKGGVLVTLPNRKARTVETE